jgi:hypothetical protein
MTPSPTQSWSRASPTSPRRTSPRPTTTFPLYDGAVVTSFRCTVGDFRVLDGHVKPKEEARQEFKKAVEKREAAALLEHTPKVFETVVGNIPRPDRGEGRDHLSEGRHGGRQEGRTGRDYPDVDRAALRHPSRGGT